MLQQRSLEASEASGCYMNDVIIWTAIASGYCQVSSRSPAMAFCDAQSSLRGFPRDRSKASLKTKDYSGRSKAHLVISTERLF